MTSSTADCTHDFGAAPRWFGGAGPNVPMLPNAWTPNDQQPCPADTPYLYPVLFYDNASY